MATPDMIWAYSEAIDSSKEGAKQTVLFPLAAVPAGHGVHTVTLALPPGLVLLPEHSVQVLPTRLVPGGQIAGAGGGMKEKSGVALTQHILQWFKLLVRREDTAIVSSKPQVTNPLCSVPGTLQAVLMALATWPAAHGVHTATMVLPPGLVLLPAHTVQVLPTRLVPAGQVLGAAKAVGERVQPVCAQKQIDLKHWLASVNGNKSMATAGLRM